MTQTGSLSIHDIEMSIEWFPDHPTQRPRITLRVPELPKQYCYSIGQPGERSSEMWYCRESADALPWVDHVSMSYSSRKDVDMLYRYQEARLTSGQGRFASCGIRCIVLRNIIANHHTSFLLPIWPVTLTSSNGSVVMPSLSPDSLCKPIRALNGSDTRYGLHSLPLVEAGSSIAELDEPLHEILEKMCSTNQ